MIRRLAVIAALATAIFSLCAYSAAAQGPWLSFQEAKSVAAKKAQKVKADLKSEGANRWKLPGCWRNSGDQVSCFFSVYGYDAEDDFSWQCMMRIVVKKRAWVHDASAGGRYKIKYGTPHCG